VRGGGAVVKATAPQHYGRVDGGVDALIGKPMDSITAFNRRMAISPINEDDRNEYVEAYNEAYEFECKLQRDHAKTGSWTVQS
jgi:hypothetical protein